MSILQGGVVVTDPNMDENNFIFLHSTEKTPMLWGFWESSFQGIVGCWPVQAPPCPRRRGLLDRWRGGGGGGSCCWRGLAAAACCWSHRSYSSRVRPIWRRKRLCSSGERSILATLHGKLPLPTYPYGKSLYKPYKYHGYTVRGTPDCPLTFASPKTYHWAKVVTHVATSTTKLRHWPVDICKFRCFSL